MSQHNETYNRAPHCRVVLLGCALITSVCLSSAIAQAEQKPGGIEASTQGALSRPSSIDWQARQGMYYKRNWGVEIVGVKPVASGYMLAFRYRVLDPDKAKMLNDRHAKAYIIDEATGTRLAVPAMENVGELRSGSSPEANRTYFMIFGNPGKVVKSGSLVSVVAGNFQVAGLVVD